MNKRSKKLHPTFARSRRVADVRSVNRDSKPCKRIAWEGRKTSFMKLGQTGRVTVADPCLDPFPPIDPGAGLAAVSRQADAVAGMLRVARALRRADRPVDLTGLDGLVGLLCARALDLPPAQGRTLRDRLIALDREFSALAIELAPD